LEQIVAIGLFSTANAQIQEGNWMVGSSLISSNFGLNTGGGYNIALQPKVYFIKDNVALGGYVNLGFSKTTSGSPSRFDYGVGALGRYFISWVRQVLIIFLTMDVGFLRVM
jgi:hypothetical protein